VLDIVVHKNVRLFEVTVSDILDSDYLPIAFHLLDHIRTRILSNPVNSDWKQFQNLFSELISPRIQINSEEEDEKEASGFTPCIASAYRISTSKITLSDLNKYIPAPENLLKHMQKLRKLVLNWVAKTIRRMTRRKALERWETKVGICEDTPEDLWSIAKPLLKRVGSKAPTAIHGSLGIIYHPDEKANVTADYLENRFTFHDLWDENHERQVETTVQNLLASVDGTPLGKVRPCDIYKLTNSLNLRKDCGLDAIPNEYLKLLPRRPLIYLTHLFNFCIRLSNFLKPWKKAKFVTSLKPGKDPKFPQHSRSISLLSTTGKLYEKLILIEVQRHIE
jgi:hypothetical protein